MRYVTFHNTEDSSRGLPDCDVV